MGNDDGGEDDLVICRIESRLLGAEELLDILGDGLGGRDRGIALIDGTVLGDQELLKVPLDTAHHQRLLLGLQVAVDGVLVFAVDIDLGHQRERHSKVELAERLDLYLGCRCVQ